MTLLERDRTPGTSGPPKGTTPSAGLTSASVNCLVAGDAGDELTRPARGAGLEESGDGGADDAPVYSIGAVSGVVGVPTVTLREWERRYGMVVPYRTTGGHQLYSPRQLARLRWVAEQLSEGETPAMAFRRLAVRITGRVGACDEETDVVVTVNDPDTAALVELVLASRSARCAALDADELVEVGQRLGPRCLVLDAAIAGASGYQMCRRICDEWDDPPPVLMLAGFGDVDRALAAGAAAFLRKPARRRDLAEALDSLVAWSVVGSDAGRVAPEREVPSR